jgi:hypothetical protein
MVIYRTYASNVSRYFTPKIALPCLFLAIGTARKYASETSQLLREADGIINLQVKSLRGDYYDTGWRTSRNQDLLRCANYIPYRLGIEAMVRS